ncbi:M48 family peptidase [Caenorhabditis elegans]|uniref:M48 family peptidase n=1 Tax=Caenorhabditis elegans TaxID=6239 RepID=H2KMK0_CAEEL|nr:M48 family peptidase [Caenorhabditis elegans]CCE71907.1 M48 family peptidase [Caenorhabditis elegans]|eukprot:NP_001256868.1 Uncharacterized protein CELE_Y43F8B.17 [Caenorhabditis elegans]
MKSKRSRVRVYRFPKHWEKRYDFQCNSLGQHLQVYVDHSVFRLFYVIV